MHRRACMQQKLSAEIRNLGVGSAFTGGHHVTDVYNRLQAVFERVNTRRTRSLRSAKLTFASYLAR